jgi:rRNA maturation protein Nop10
MSFTIKCDACGHVAKFRKSKRRNNDRRGRPILIIKKHYGDVPDWYTLRCSVCGHEEEEI